jgi:hypothetical protein
MGNKIWKFSPFDELEYKKSAHRVMFVGADPNGDKEGDVLKRIKDMGEWFEKAPANKYFGRGGKQFYTRTEIMLKGILPNVRIL